MVCEICKREENYEDTKGKDILLVGVCGSCHKITICQECIDGHLDSCIPYQMELKKTSIIQ